MFRLVLGKTLALIMKKNAGTLRNLEHFFLHIAQKKMSY